MDYPGSLEFRGSRGRGAPQVNLCLMNCSSITKLNFSFLSNIVSTFSGKCYNVSPVLTEVEQERFDQISGTLEKGQFYLIKDVLRSKSFLQIFSLDSGRMASNGGNNAKEKPTSDAAHVATNEVESSLS